MRDLRVRQRYWRPQRMAAHGWLRRSSVRAAACSPRGLGCVWVACPARSLAAAHRLRQPVAQQPPACSALSPVLASPR